MPQTNTIPRIHYNKTLMSIAKIFVYLMAVKVGLSAQTDPMRSSIKPPILVQLRTLFCSRVGANFANNLRKMY